MIIRMHVCSHSHHVHDVFSTVIVTLPYLIHSILSGLQQGSLRLVGSTSTYFYAGRLEIYVSGQWGTVCDDGWGNNEAIVACGQMGFEGAYASDWTLSSSGSSSQTIWLDDVTCTGSESQLINCNHRGLGVENCGHSEDIGIRCTRLVTSESPMWLGVHTKYVRTGEYNSTLDVTIRASNLRSEPCRIDIIFISISGIFQISCSYLIQAHFLLNPSPFLLVQLQHPLLVQLALVQLALIQLLV